VTVDTSRALPSGYRIRRARSEDASAIYLLKVEAFGDKYLSYTIYQATQSVSYLEQLIADSPERSYHDLHVLEQDGTIRGYYDAVRLPEEYLLNYIAVTRETRGLGLGGILLRHFEDAGKSIGCKALALDVFASNSSVSAWYYRHGYHLVAASFHVRLAIDALAGNNAPALLCENSVWGNAYNEEKVQGFSKVACRCGSGYLIVGLIAGNICKLLDFTGLSLRDAAGAIANHFEGEREYLIISALRDLPQDLPILDAERHLHLHKTIRG